MQRKFPATLSFFVGRLPRGIDDVVRNAGKIALFSNHELERIGFVQKIVIELRREPGKLLRVLFEFGLAIWRQVRATTL